MYKNESSNHPLQLKLNQKSKAKINFQGYVFLFLAIAGSLCSIFLVPRACYSLIELAIGEPVVNVNYFLFFLLGGVPISYSCGLVGYSLLVYKRVVVTHELKPFFEKTFNWGGVLGLVLSLGGGLALSVLTAPLIWANGYSHCAEMSRGSGWDPYWVKDSRLCSSYAR